MSTIAIRVLWALPSTTALINLKWQIPLVLEAFRAPDVKGDVKKLMAKPVGRFNSLMIVWNIGIIIVALFKIIDPEKNTISPTDPAPWNILCLGACIFYWGVTIFNKMQIKLALKGMGAKGDKKMEKLNQTVSLLNPKAALDNAILVAAVIIGNVGNGTGNRKLMTVSYLVFNGWRFLTMLLTLWQVITMRMSVNKAFEGIGDNVKEGEKVDASTQKIIKLKNSMKHFVKDAFKAVFINGSLTLIFVAYQGLWAKWGYFTPIQQLLGTTVILGAKTIFVKEVKKKVSGNKVAAGVTGTTTVTTGASSSTTTSSTNSSEGSSNDPEESGHESVDH